MPSGIIRVRMPWPFGCVVGHPRGLVPRARPALGELPAVQRRSSSRPLPASTRCHRGRLLHGCGADRFHHDGSRCPTASDAPRQSVRGRRSVWLGQRASHHLCISPQDHRLGRDGEGFEPSQVIAPSVPASAPRRGEAGDDPARRARATCAKTGFSGAGRGSQALYGGPQSETLLAVGGGRFSLVRQDS